MFAALRRCIAQGGTVRLAEELRKGANAGVLDPKHGLSLVHVAMQENNAAVVPMLVTKGASLDAPARNGETPLLRAIRKRNVRWVEILLTHGASPNMGNPIFAAVMHRDAASLRLLLEHGAHVWGRNDLGQTALHLAARLADEDAVRTLLSFGADPNALDMFSQGVVLYLQASANKEKKQRIMSLLLGTDERTA